MLGLEEALSRSWARGWLKKHESSLSWLKPKPVEPPRVEACTTTNIEHWFDEMTTKTPIARYHHSRSSNFTKGESVRECSRLNGAWVYNMDETWITSEERSLRVIVPREWSTAPKITETDKTIHYTLIFCISADGQFIPATVILPKLQFFPGDINDLHEFLCWSASSSGWIDSEIYEKWVKQVFVPAITIKRTFLRCPNHPVVLLLDGHSTRSSQEAKDTLAAANVFIITIPSHTSHVLQPLDCGVNRNFKGALRKAITHNHPPGVQGKRRMVLEAGIHAAHIAHAPRTVLTAFKNSGVHPWDKNVILQDLTKVTEGSGSNENLPNRSSRGPKISGRVLVDPSLHCRIGVHLAPATLQSNHYVLSPPPFALPPE